MIEPHEEGEPERINMDLESLDEETFAALVDMGVEFPCWIPEIPPKKSIRRKARIRSIKRA